MTTENSPLPSHLTTVEAYEAAHAKRTATLFARELRELADRIEIEAQAFDTIPTQGDASYGAPAARIHGLTMNVLATGGLNKMIQEAARADHARGARL